MRPNLPLPSEPRWIFDVGDWVLYRPTGEKVFLPDGREITLNYEKTARVVGIVSKHSYHIRILDRVNDEDILYGQSLAFGYELAYAEPTEEDEIRWVIARLQGD